MTRIFVMGYAPLPLEDALRNIAPGNRTWQLIKPLLDAGHDVCLVAFRIPNAYANDPPDQLLIPNYPQLTYHSCPTHKLYDVDFLQGLMDRFKPDCVLGIMTEASSCLARLNFKVPFWADLYGSALAEAQIQAQVKSSNHYLSYVIASEKLILRSADKISTVSSHQRFAVMGELGLVGRLNSYTAGYEFVHVMPAYMPITQSLDYESSILRDHQIPTDSFVVLSSGGYNNWTDAETLFNGLERAIRKDSRIHFVSTGGQIEGHDDVTYRTFTERVQQSIYKDHFHLLGWVDQSIVHQLYRECDVGIIADKACYETELGSRTRLMAWVDAGLVPIVNPITEIAIDMIHSKIAFTFPQGDADRLSDLLVDLASNSALLSEVQKNRQIEFKARYSIHQTSAPLLDWIRSDTPYAPDHRENSVLHQNGGHPALPFTQSWFELLQPIWSKLIFDLSRSRLQFIMPFLKKISRLVKRRNRS